MAREIGKGNDQEETFLQKSFLLDLLPKTPSKGDSLGALNEACGALRLCDAVISLDSLVSYAFAKKFIKLPRPGRDAGPYHSGSDRPPCRSDWVCFRPSRD